MPTHEYLPMIKPSPVELGCMISDYLEMLEHEFPSVSTKVQRWVKEVLEIALPGIDQRVIQSFIASGTPIDQGITGARMADYIEDTLAEVCNMIQRADRQLNPALEASIVSYLEKRGSQFRLNLGDLNKDRLIETLDKFQSTIRMVEVVYADDFSDELALIDLTLSQLADRLASRDTIRLVKSFAQAWFETSFTSMVVYSTKPNISLFDTLQSALKPFGLKLVDGSLVELAVDTY